jgi:chaperone modulatory protein CbpM
MIDITLHIAMTDLCKSEGIEKDLIIEVVEYGIAQPLSETEYSQWVFDLDSAHWIKKAIQLNQQLLLDWVAISLVIELMKEKEKLEQENAHLRTRLSRLGLA